MPWWVWIVIGVTLVDLFIFMWLIPRVVSGMTASLANAYPPAEPAPDTVWKHRQSMSVGVINMGFCFDMGADDAMLHIRPNRFGRWWKMPALSVPWDEIHVTGRRVQGNAKIGKHTVNLPCWVRELARPAPDAG